MAFSINLRLGRGGNASGESEPLAPPEGMVHWYDFSDSDNYTLSGSDITQAEDIGSGSATLTSEATKYPVVGTINGVNAAHFDGTNDILKSTTGLADAFDADGAAYTKAVVFQLDTVAFGSGGASGLLSMAYHGATDPYLGLIASSSSDNWGWFLVDALANTAPVYQAGQDTNPHVMVAVIKTDETADLWLDGVKVRTAVSIDTASFRSLDRHIAIGGLSLFVDSEAWFLDGKIGEAMAYASALSDSDVGDLNAYLMDKWGIS